MNYPLISEYIEAIKSAEDNFKELTNLRPVLGDDEQPVMTSGNFAVVFKMQDEETGKFYALKCFIKEQEGREEAYHQIAKALENVDSPYLISIQYLDKELFVDTDQTTETEFPVLLMDWVEGKTLDKYLRENLDDKYELEMLAYRFSQLAQWLIPQPFAHGDLKPDNILVREDGTLVLVDYDGMYVPAMKGQKARELGSPDFRHPLRTENDFDEHIDDFPLISILLSLKVLSIYPQWLNDYCASDRLLFSEKDYYTLNNCDVIRLITPSDDNELNRISSAFIIILSDYTIISLPIQLYQCHVSLACQIHYYDLGEKYKKGIGLKQDVTLSVSNYKIAAELGYTKAQYKLGVCYSTGCGVDVNFYEAIRWYKIAADQGSIEALYDMGIIYQILNIPFATSIFNDTVKKATIALDSQEGETEALGVLGGCLLHGQGIQKDEYRAFKYLKQAAEKGHYTAQAFVGYCYYCGKGVEVNKTEAVKWFELSSNQGNSFGKTWLGKCYMRADGVAENKTLGIQLLKNAANQGNSLSHRLLGIYYFLGDGIKQDYDLAFYLFDKSAERGNRGGMYALALCYENGFGTMPNRDKARYWYEKAAEKGNHNAIKALERFNNSNFGDKQIEQVTEIELMRTNVKEIDISNVWKDEFGVVYSADTKHLIEGPVKETQKGAHIWKIGVLKNSYNIPEGILSICDKAFFDCRDLISIKCPDSLMAIGAGAFQNCLDLKEVNLGHNIMKIGNKAFKNCKSLHSIYIPESLTYVAKNSFEGSGLNIIYTSYGDKNRIESMLPNYKEIIEELPF